MYLIRSTIYHKAFPGSRVTDESAYLCKFNDGHYDFCVPDNIKYITNKLVLMPTRLITRITHKRLQEYIQEYVEHRLSCDYIAKIDVTVASEWKDGVCHSRFL